MSIPCDASLRLRSTLDRNAARMNATCSTPEVKDVIRPRNTEAVPFCGSNAATMTFVSTWRPRRSKRFAPRSMRAIEWMGAHAPRLLLLFARLGRRMIGYDAASIEKFFVRSAAHLGAADQQLLSNSEIRGQFAQAMAESFRQGAQGNLEVVLALAGSWGFQVEQVAFERVFLWHGEQDRIVSVAPARLLAQLLPHCTATFYPDEGHLSTVVHHAQDIFRLLSGQSSPVQALPQDDAMEEGHR